MVELVLGNTFSTYAPGPRSIIMFGLVMLLVDIIYAFVDPRIKSQYQSERRKAHG